MATPSKDINDMQRPGRRIHDALASVLICPLYCAGTPGETVTVTRRGTRFYLTCAACGLRVSVPVQALSDVIQPGTIEWHMVNAGIHIDKL